MIHLRLFEPRHLFQFVGWSLAQSPITPKLKIKVRQFGLDLPPKSDDLDSCPHKSAIFWRIHFLGHMFRFLTQQFKIHILKVMDLTIQLKCHEM